MSRVQHTANRVIPDANGVTHDRVGGNLALPFLSLLCTCSAMLLIGCGKADDSSTEPKVPPAQTKAAPSQTNTSATTEPVARAKPIDLLKKYDIKNGVIYGKAERDNGVLTTQELNGFSLVKISEEPSAEYDLEADVTRLGGNGSLLLGIVLPTGHCGCLVDSWPKQGYLTALDSVDGKRPGFKTYPLPELVHRGAVLPKDKQVTFVCRVRRDGVSLSVNGQEVFHFRGDLKRLTFPKHLNRAAAKRAFYIGGNGSQLKISRLQLRPLGPVVEAAKSLPVRNEWSLEPPPTPPGMGPGGMMNPGATSSLAIEGNALVAKVMGPMPIMHLLNQRRLDGDYEVRISLRMERNGQSPTGQELPSLFGVRSLNPMGRPAMSQLPWPDDPSTEVTLVVKRTKGKVTTEYNGTRQSMMTPPQFSDDGNFFIQIPVPSTLRIISFDIEQSAAVPAGSPAKRSPPSKGGQQPRPGNAAKGGGAVTASQDPSGTEPTAPMPPKPIVDDDDLPREARTIVRPRPPVKPPRVIADFEDWELLATGQSSVDEKLTEQISLERDDRGIRVLVKSNLPRTVWMVNRNRVDGDFHATVCLESATKEEAREAKVGTDFASVGFGIATERGIGKGRTVGASNLPGASHTFEFQRIGAELLHQLDGKSVGGTAGNVSGPLVAGVSVTRSGLFWITDYRVKPLPGPVSSAANFVGQPIREVPLRGTVKDAFLGGRGKFLILRMEGPARVDVIELNGMTLVQEMPLEDVGSLLAASADYLFVYSPRICRLFRFNLPDLSLPEIKQWDAKEALSGIYAGCSSTELLLAESRVDAARATLIFLDVETLEPANVIVNAPMPLRWESSSIVRSSANGVTFGIQGSPSATLIEVRGTTAEVRRAESFVKLAVPSADGKTVFTDRYINQPIRNARFEPINEDGIQRHQPAAPAVQEPFYVTVYTPSSWQEGDNFRGRVSLQMLPHVRPLATFSDLVLVSTSNSHYSKKSTLTLDKRLICDPVKGQIVCIPHSNDRLLVKQFDLASLLSDSTLDYLVVTSEPQKTVNAGQTYQYRLTTLARGRVQIDLESAPEGMRVSPDGLLTWAAPQIQEDRVERISIAVRGGGVTKQFQNFELLVRGTGKPLSVADPVGVADSTVNRMPRATDDNRDATSPDGVEVLQLPAPCDNIAHGGGGRYLVAHLKQLRKLAILDLVERKISGYIDVPADEIFFAASAEKLVVVIPALKQVQRYDLATLHWELTAPLTNKKPITVVAMGPSSNGPVLIGGGDREGDELTLRELDTLQVRKVTVGGTRHVRFSDGVRVMAAADGETFACWHTAISPTGLQLLVVSRDTIDARYSHVTVEFAVPSFDGSLLFTKKGIYDRDLTVDRPDGIGRSFAFLPVAQPSQRLRIRLEGDEDPANELPAIALLEEGQDEPLARWTEVLLPKVGERNLMGRITSSLADRVFLVHDRPVIATMPASNDRVRFWPADE